MRETGRGLGGPTATGFPAAPAAPAAPEQPQAPANVPTNPFLTAADLQAINEFTTQWALRFSEIDKDLANLRADTDFRKKATDKQAKVGTSNTQDSAAARGLFMSSIKDAQLFDIEGERASQQAFLDAAMTRAVEEANNEKTYFETVVKYNFDQNMLTQQVENARAVDASKPPPPTPTAPAPAAPVAPTAPAQPSSQAGQQPTTSRPQRPRPNRPRPATGLVGTVTGRPQVGLGTPRASINRPAATPAAVAYSSRYPARPR